jgi:integrase
MARALERACARAGIVDDAGRPLVSPHRLRHSAASVMLRERVPWPVVAAQLGHADPAITARIYSHLIDDRDLDLAAGAFEARHAPEGLGQASG